MSHNIMERDELFTVRQPAWHGLGQTLDDYPTRQEAQALVHPWEPVSEPIYINQPVVDENGVRDNFVQVEDQKAVTRSDGGGVLGVVGDGYEPVTNHEMWDIAEALQKNAKDVKFETAGSLLNGAKVWILVRLEEPIIENKLDPHSGVIPYYALQNAHNGTGAFRGQATMTRVVCDNTARVSDMEARTRGTEFIFKHTKNVKNHIDEARQALEGWRESITEWQLIVEHLNGLKVDKDGRERFIERFIPAPAQGIASERVMNNVEQSRQTMRSLLNGETLEGINGNAYGLVQAGIEYGQHYRKSHSTEGLFKRAYLDDSRLTRDAMKIAQEVAVPA